MSGTPTNSARLAARRGRDASGRLPWLAARRALLAVLVALTTLVGAGLMWHILQPGGITPLQWGILTLFSVIFAWIAVGFWTAVAGFLLLLADRDPLTLAHRPRVDAERTQPITRRTVLAMPIHNESPSQVAATLSATAESLIATGEAHHFTLFVLSDTTDPAIAAAEARAIAGLQGRLEGRLALHYRRRPGNAGRKAGNIAEFCRRWGATFDFMVVLDADSRMEGETLLGLVRAMQARPGVGLIQTVPLPVRQHTLFGRLAQFAASLYAPMLAAGQSAWQGDAANYWGHNAILRLGAFMDHAGLPRLPGRPPLGGEILSHDFVEAALLRRAGWEVQLETRLTGSFEEMPGNLLDYARRDRRWTQGNLQHLRLLAAPGLHGLSRLHFLLGATAFVSSLLWLAILLAGSLDAVLIARSEPAYFGHGEQLFPFWPRARPELIAALLAMTATLLLLPKLLGLLLALGRRAGGYGGRARLVMSALLEGLAAILLAPIMMAFHSAFVVGVLTGTSVDWGAQAREGRVVPWREALRHTAPFALLGGVWIALVHWQVPMLVAWLAPVWVGLALSPLLVRVSGSRRLGEWLARRGLLDTPEPQAHAGLLEARHDLVADDAAETDTPAPWPPPPECPGEMPTQSLHKESR
ncbi:glucans biosynthesis glucosyltransferase MdoH [Halomonas mongoliensis]|uniref:Glucans biosynthesis glucosyltransferase H n=1 Tax=Halomonas mongoliensis TaxID=321265 RepID=A0ABU1GHD7_9GAMM|nr:glucans biosynthesis glucosyltransferase MdoH [Halomonas mongoliensis]MDR5891419.1 glucans biosynthesis glucosyltransferase MdoH [Halomonas mongoliensis]